MDNGKNASVRMELNYKISVTREHFVCKAQVSKVPKVLFLQTLHQLMITACLCLRRLLLTCPIAIAYSMGQLIQETHQEMR